MENASKALIMAGGVLISLLVIGALLLMLNQVSDYRSSETQLVSDTQLAQFNEQYTRYARNDVMGVDIITLANKVADYNTKSGGVGELNYELPITLTITLGEGFKNKLGGNLYYFTKKSYEVSTSNSEFLNIVERNRKLESYNTINGLKQLISNLDAIKDGSLSIKDVIGKDFRDEDGSVLSGSEAVKVIQNYEEYSSLKSCTFKISEEPEYYEEGQIKSMKFEFVK